MSETTTKQRVVLASRPEGAPTEAHFRYESAELPALEEGQVHLKTEYLSLDPYMRLRMNAGESYADPVEVDEVMVGGTITRVANSRHPKFTPGDLITGFTAWESDTISDGVGLAKLDPNMPNPSWALGVLGMPGFTAHYGLLTIGEPKAGETLVVAAATGAVGSIVGQIAKIKGCRTVGIAGGAEKCQYAVEELGFDVCLDHRSGDLPAQLAAACPDGIDVYFENVGGAVFDAVLPLLNVKARVPLCGVIASYNGEGVAEGPDRSVALITNMLVKQIKMQGFVILDYYETHYVAFLKDMGGWIAEGRIKIKEDITEGLENAPKAFIGMLRGENFGKTVVKVAS